MLHQKQNKILVLSVIFVLNFINLFLHRSAQAHQTTCRGQYLVLNIEENLIGETNKFKFTLDIETEALNRTSALRLLNKKIENIRNSLRPISLNQIRISSQRIYSIKTQNDLPAREIGTAFIQGEVKSSSYNQFINSINNIPGVRIESIISLISNESKINLNKQLIQSILEKGNNKAKTYSHIIKKSQINLVSIKEMKKDNFPPYYSSSDNDKTSSKSYNLEKPIEYLNLSLMYCIEE